MLHKFKYVQFKYVRKSNEYSGFLLQMNKGSLADRLAVCWLRQVLWLKCLKSEN